MRPDTIVGYTFQAEMLCPDCIIEPRLAEAGLASVNAKEESEKYGVETTLDYIASVNAIDRADEATFDSDEFPKVVLRQMLDDGVEQCNCCGEPIE